MKTTLKIELSSTDCAKIYKDLDYIKKTNGLSPETYLLFNKIKGMNCSYVDIEK